jgi:hypothetical protein
MTTAQACMTFHAGHYRRLHNDVSAARICPMTVSWREKHTCPAPCRDSRATPRYCHARASGSVHDACELRCISACPRRRPLSRAFDRPSRKREAPAHTFSPPTTALGRGRGGWSISLFTTHDTDYCIPHSGRSGNAPYTHRDTHTNDPRTLRSSEHRAPDRHSKPVEGARERASRLRVDCRCRVQ